MGWSGVWDARPRSGAGARSYRDGIRFTSIDAKVRRGVLRYFDKPWKSLSDSPKVFVLRIEIE